MSLVFESFAIFKFLYQFSFGVLTLSGVNYKIHINNDLVIHRQVKQTILLKTPLSRVQMIN